jgi:outer membrane protein OmpA-like peptidoglycan-associated protein
MQSSYVQTQKTTGSPGPAATVLQRACACGQHTPGGGGECSECRRKREASLQRSATSTAPISTVPPIVYEVLRSPGRPLDSATRAYMEPRFGHDFSQVRVHTDQKAAQSASAVNALAYTVGQDIVFNKGQYAPLTGSRQRLIGHELTHVIQQDTASAAIQPKLIVGPPNGPAEAQAEQMAETLVSSAANIAQNIPQTAQSVQRACMPAAIGQPEGCIIPPDYGFFITDQPFFMFDVNCDNFALGQDLNLAAFANSLPSTATFEIHGYASVDGDPNFNHNLACARALKARDLLVGAGIDPGRIIGIFNHGQAPGPAAERRSVVIRPTIPVPPAPEPRPRRAYPHVRVWVNSFIPHERVDGPPGSECFAGDNRTFSSDPSASSRTHQLMEVQAATPNVLTNIRRIGTTHEVACDTGNVIDTGRASESELDNSGIFGQRTSAQADVFFEANASNPLVTGAPAINLDAEFHLNLATRVCIFHMDHDGFPGYEAYISPDGEPATAIYTYDPRDHGEGITALFPPMDWTTNRRVSF